MVRELRWAVRRRDASFDVVTINYRYGLLGYFAHESLAAEDPNGSTGNYGLLDQIKALNWVHDNIQHLGGDKGRVSLYGQSVGGMDICSLLTTPLSSTDLFQSAIISSEPGCNRPTKQWVERNVGNVAVANVGCAGASDIPGCLRSLSASQIRSSFAIGSPTWRIGSNVDGYALREEPMAAIQGGRYLHMPIMQGGGADEPVARRCSVRGTGPVITDDDYQRHIRYWFAVYGGTVADDVLAKYPSDTFGPPVVTFIRVMTDALETAVARRVARALANIQSEPVRRFVFTRGLANAPFTSFGAQHGIDLPFAFHNLNITAINGQVYTPTTRELGFADIVSGYWARSSRQAIPTAGEPRTGRCTTVVGDLLQLRRHDLHRGRLAGRRLRFLGRHSSRPLCLYAVRRVLTRCGGGRTRQFTPLAGGLSTQEFRRAHNQACAHAHFRRRTRTAQESSDQRNTNP